MAPPFLGWLLLCQTFGVSALFPIRSPGVVFHREHNLRIGHAGPMAASPPTLVRLCGRAEWQAALVCWEHRPASLSDVGFVHLSTVEQVHLPANRLFAGRRDLVLLYPGIPMR